jgi:hypothetical protein
MKKTPRISARPQKKTKEEIKKEKAKTVVKTLAFKNLKKTYCEWRALVGEFDQVPVNILSNFYREKIESAFKPGILTTAIFDFEDKEIETGLKHGHSNDAKIKLANFPSLNRDLPIHPQTNAGVTIGSLELNELKEWNKKNAWEACKGSPIARFLLAYIWKMNNFAKVRNVLEGFHEAPSTPVRKPRGQAGRDEEEIEEKANDENAIVMRQFGRHLRSATTQPIFDQHTARYLIVSEQIEKKPGMRYKTYCELFTKGNIPDSAPKLRTAALREEFVTWWDRHIALKGDGGSNSDKYLWADRIMFSLGKAAGLVAPKKEREGPGRTPKAASTAEK